MKTTTQTVELARWAVGSYDQDRLVLDYESLSCTTAKDWLDANPEGYSYPVALPAAHAQLIVAEQERLAAAADDEELQLTSEGWQE